MQLKELAAALGISPAMVTKLKKRGMPVASVQAAEKWRRRHLEFARTKGVKFGTERSAPAASGHVSAPPPPVVPASPTGLVDARSLRLLRLVEELGVAALDSIQRRSFVSFAPVLRQAMSQVPIELREQVALPLEVWNALTAAIPDDLEPSAEQTAAGDLDDQFMGTFWYQIALGELADMHLVPKTL